MRKSASKSEETRLELELLAENALKTIGVKNARISVFFLPPRQMSSLKYKYLGIRRKFVDVLAFPEPKGFPQPGSRKKTMGEVYLNSLLLRGEKKELLHLLFHGVLHILGFSHGNKSDTIEMESYEEKLLKKFFRR